MKNKRKERIEKLAPIELKPDHLKIEPDHVLADMLRAMHLTVNAVTEAFEPESGAYASGGHTHGVHGHDHPGQSDHPHAGSVPTAAKKLSAIPVKTSAAAVPHIHGPDCKHEH